jgi:cytidylate kinase
MFQQSRKEMLIVAIDGPAAAGKSTVARAVAARLGLTYVDTGAMYRALTLKALQRAVDPEDGATLARLASETLIEFRPSANPSGSQQVWLDGQDVTREIRASEVDLAVSAVSKHGPVREQFVQAQRRMASAGGVVMEGRDVGTVVLPEANVKVYLDASLEARVQRRFVEQVGRGARPAMDALAQDLARRDAQDSGRKVAPLSVAPGAVRVDTTHRTLEQVLDEVTRLCLERKGTV